MTGRVAREASRPDRRPSPAEHESRATAQTPLAPPPATAPATTTASPSRKALDRLPIIGQRRQFLLDPRVQLRTVALVCSVVIVLLVVLNLAMHSLRSNRTAALTTDIPELAAVLQAQDRTELTLVALASIVFLVGVFAVTLLETHRTAGAAYNLGHRIDDVRAGRYDVRLHLRHGDTLRKLEVPFNEMVGALQDRAWADVDALETLADEAESIGTPLEAQELSAKLRSLAVSKRLLAG
jgi:hypothetical protein